MILVIVFLSTFIFADTHLFSYLDDDEMEDVFEPLCDIDFDGEEDCEMFLSFASTNWHQNDYRGCIDQYKTALYCNCREYTDESLEIYKYLGRAFLEIGILDNAKSAPNFFFNNFDKSPKNPSEISIAQFVKFIILDPIMHGEGKRYLLI